MSDTFVAKLPDCDPSETKEWLDSLRALIKYQGPARAHFILGELMAHAPAFGLSPFVTTRTSYINTIARAEEEKLPDDGKHLLSIANYNRWNTIAMVMRGGKRSSELGGHIASYGGTALLYEIGFNYFFHGASENHGGDLLYIQGHSAPGIYSRAYLEGRMTEKQIDNFRQEVHAGGVSSYPHPWLMPDFWQFPTVSMGLGPIMSIYQARFLKYLHKRGLADTENRTVWAFCGDGEMGEPESLGALYLAGREQLDNLVFVVSCNLQRLDGPVYGNGRIIQELEGIFRGNGWYVIKSIWGSGWDKLFAKDVSGLLLKRFSELTDGEYQVYASRDGAFLRENFFGKYPELLELVSHLSDEELKEQCQDAGNDPQKIYAAYSAAKKQKKQPTVILIKTVKGFGMGPAGEGLNKAHQAKKMDVESLKLFCSRFNVPIKEKEIEKLPFIKFNKDSDEYKYLMDQRKKLGGFLPHRDDTCPKITMPSEEAFAHQYEGSAGREISTTMSFVRILTALLKEGHIKEHIVPIVADESRTFGMEGLFRQIGIYSPFGQQYTPEDRKQLMYYREDERGQMLQEGITEAGGMSSWIAAATSYSTNKVPMIPFYIYYSMFGFQRFGDLCWAAGDMRARGFILGATAGRTTLAGEGLQHQDGHNLLMFSFVPNCVSYDPTFSYELAVIIKDGIKRMYVDQESVYYYITLMNENYEHPAMPKGVEANLLKGMYLFSENKQHKTTVQLLGAGAILREVIKAAELLQEFKVSANVWSVTSFNECRKDIESVTRHNRLHPEAKPKQSHVAKCLQKQKGPVIAATDYIKLVADQIRQDVPNPYYVLGTDGYGRSDTRENLRDFFEVDAKMIAYTALKALADQGEFKSEDLAKAMKKLQIDPTRPDPVTV